MLLSVTVFWTIFYGTITLLVFPIDYSGGKMLGKIVKYWARTIFFTAGIKSKIVGLDNIDHSKNYIFAANHSSSLDIPLMLGYIPFWIVPVSKVELKWIPFLGWAMQMGGHVFVDRSNHEKAMSSLKKAKDSLMKRPRSILLFPEGSRTDDGRIKQFKSGGLSIAIETKIPVVPVAIFGTFESLNKRSWHFKNQVLVIKIGKPIHSNEYTNSDRKTFANLVHDKVQEIKNKNL